MDDSSHNKTPNLRTSNHFTNNWGSLLDKIRIKTCKVCLFKKKHIIMNIEDNMSDNFCMISLQ